MGRTDAAAMLHITTWLWGTKFSTDDVAKLVAGVQRNLQQPHRILCLVDRLNHRPIDGVVYRRIIDGPLTAVRGCFARLRMFDPEWQRSHDISDGERIANIDLDTVITGPLDALFDRPEPFVIMQGGNSANPCPYNGALFMLRAGTHADVWREFSLKAAGLVPFYEFPDDQGWLWHKVPDAAGWKCGAESGIYVFHKPGWPGWKNTKDSLPSDGLPPGARLVTFSGWRNPKRFVHLDWVKENW